MVSEAEDEHPALHSETEQTEQAEQVRTLVERIDALEARLNQVVTHDIDRHVIHWKQRVAGPDGVAYILVREAGGNAAFIATPGDSASWSDA